MTHVVTENCIRCKYMDCVEVCPVDCFYEGENMLVIHPDECIDCAVCVPECPANAIFPDTESGLEPWMELRRVCRAVVEHHQKRRRVPGCRRLQRHAGQIPPLFFATARPGEAMNSPQTSSVVKAITYGEHQSSTRSTPGLDLVCP